MQLSRQIYYFIMRYMAVVQTGIGIPGKGSIRGDESIYRVAFLTMPPFLLYLRKLVIFFIPCNG